MAKFVVTYRIVLAGTREVEDFENEDQARREAETEGVTTEMLETATVEDLEITSVTEKEQLKA